ncbi:hypothetical protein LB518_14135 [Mesorhizobium sp. BR1-1-16]|uniref:hypothetical protein n=1 Tax=Mesorhizobium sp. BR1-1-16 TaxID=2876653 RepID=UPI001CCB36E2|nr:hypothetical protein [Mesorhizobium sp. BR1-1-16]MBZ9937440.1 hypothetical protein [Mesorhizobium sp. BR1-1-16]
MIVPFVVIAGLDPAILFLKALSWQGRPGDFRAEAAGVAIGSPDRLVCQGYPHG